VDDREIRAEAGLNLLSACLANDIFIPNLCFLERMTQTPASCRLCYVEIEGEKAPVPACTRKVSDHMVVKTDTPAVRRLQRSALQLLLSVHEVECAKCPANKRCELQRIARFLKTGLKPKGLEKRLKETPAEDGHPFLEYYPNRCVLCGKCVHVCEYKNGRAFLTFAKRGLDTIISFYGENRLQENPCKTCHVCVDVCPVAALTRKERCIEAGEM
jgi:NADH dehydrogenase/NADH:ubiquinone oxidoreductase subunit G